MHGVEVIIAVFGPRDAGYRLDVLQAQDRVDVFSSLGERELSPASKVGVSIIVCSICKRGKTRHSIRLMGFLHGVVVVVVVVVLGTATAAATVAQAANPRVDMKYSSLTIVARTIVPRHDQQHEPKPSILFSMSIETTHQQSQSNPSFHFWLL